MQTKTKVLIGVGVAAMAGVVWFMRKKTGNQQPATNFSNQQAKTSLLNQQLLPVQIPGSPIVISEQTKRDIQNAFNPPIVNSPIDQPIYNTPVYTPIVNRPIYDAPIYDQEYRRGGRGRIGVDEGYRDEAIAGLRGLSYLLR
jgi:hypothetical protein